MKTLTSKQELFMILLWKGLVDSSMEMENLRNGKSSQDSALLKFAWKQFETK